MVDGFPDLGDWHETRRSLHSWSKVLSAVRGALVEAHPRWWHISLTVTSRGLSTGPLGGGEPAGPVAELDLQNHELTFRAGDRRLGSLSLASRPTSDRLASWLLEQLAPGPAQAAGTAVEERRDDSPRLYEPAAADGYWQALSTAARELAAVRDAIAGSRGPVQFWAHHFDVAFELFGNRLVDRQGDSQPAQVGFGFFPGDDQDPRAYFYGTPWPFSDDLLDTPLPPPARWQKEPWEGARLPYSAAIEDGSVVGSFLRAVHASGRSVLDG